MLAEAFIYQKDRKDIDFSKWTVVNIKNKEEFYIPKSENNMVFSDIGQAEVFDSLITNLSNGYDIAELLEENSGNNEENTKE